SQRRNSLAARLSRSAKMCPMHRLPRFAVACLAGALIMPGALAQGATPSPQETEVWNPEPRVVTPGATDAAPPSDAIVLFGGTDLGQWESTRDRSPAGW